MNYKFARLLICIQLTLLLFSGCAKLSISKEDIPSTHSENMSPASAPFVPLTTNFWSYWDHYWTTWLPDHPIYEMIELTVYEGNGASDELLLRVILSERAGNKRQHFYLNKIENYERKRPNVFQRDIEYRRIGAKGEPQGLYLSFVDQSGTRVEWSVSFGSTASLDDYDGGATSSIHSVGGLLLLALRTQFALTYNDSAKFGDVEYASLEAPNKDIPRIRSWYNPNYYSAIILMGSLEFNYKDGILSNSWGRTFNEVDGEADVLRTATLGPDNYVDLYLDDHGGTKGLSHFSHGHSLNFTINPALPPLREFPEGEGASFQFTAEFDNRGPLMSGNINTFRTDDFVILEWSPEKPDWAQDRIFWTALQITDTGYKMRLTDDRKVIYGQD